MAKTVSNLVINGELCEIKDKHGREEIEKLKQHGWNPDSGGTPVDVYTKEESDEKYATKEETGNLKSEVDDLKERFEQGGNGPTKEDLSDYYTKAESDARYAFKGESGGSGEATKKSLPKLMLTGSFEGMTKDVKKRLSYIYIDSDGYTQESGWCEMKWQGQTSAGERFPKKNFKITLFKDPYFKNKDKHEYHDGWGKENKYTLKANMTDLSQAKNVTCARVFGAITKMRKAYPEGLADTANHGSVDGFPFLIYLNEEYHGLYMWMVDKSNMTDIDDENPLQAIVSGWTNTQVEIPDEMPADVQTGLSALKEFWNNTTGDDFKNGLDAYLDVESLIDYIIHMWFFAGIDNLGGNNFYYMTYDSQKFYMTAYDMDSTLGNGLQGAVTIPYNLPFLTATEKGQWNVDDTTQAFWAKVIEYFWAEIIERYDHLRKTALSVDFIEREISSIMDAIGLEAYTKDNLKWGFTGTSQQNKQNIFTWLENRAEFVDSEIHALNENYVECTGIEIDQTSIVFENMNPVQITATKTPSNATDAVSWKTSAKAVATVSARGIVTPVGDGECTITATCGNHSASCTVTINMGEVIEWYPTKSYEPTESTGVLNTESTWGWMTKDFNVNQGEEVYLMNYTGYTSFTGLDASANPVAQGTKNSNRWNGLVLSVPEHSNIKKGRLFCSGENLNGVEVVRRSDREWCGYCGFRICDDGVIRTKVNLEGHSIITADRNTFVSRVSVPVVAGHKYHLDTVGTEKSGQPLSYFGAMFYDASGNYIGFDMDTKSGSMSYEVTAPENAIKATYFVNGNQGYNWASTQDADLTSPEGWLSWVES